MRRLLYLLLSSLISWLGYSAESRVVKAINCLFVNFFQPHVLAIISVFEAIDLEINGRQEPISYQHTLAYVSAVTLNFQLRMYIRRRKIWFKKHKVGSGFF